ncbi:hypothetical protein SARC_00811 [Sphaeroforma arctica JP610]|uniref:Hemimethylated DNA-binding domain-containing protein n=1 Tax=Sphaeroforma arctica JP610 TaxID=667725 RepID=A0A0L0GDJ7_9EUKA|nr:hypothetical protein SARC_00811 [Sphaeroforma arctica JP610]KNC87067.1 hypothetical protein SARC_00811 [Sphaeroforma arctica JP610]|eukprot:XP_014160969.1 hypothetical protein SARC_00811 [Sphaeroforma arctica JP610]
MDATIHPRLVARHNIHAFPSLLLYINGDIDNPSHYQGPREAVDVIDWTLETAANPPLSSFYGFAQNPRYLRFRYDISYRIGDVVHLTTDEREMPHLGVIVGWDYTMQAPAVSSENKLKPHYRVLWDTSKGQAIPEDTNSNLGEHSSPNVNYLCQDDLDLYIGRVTTIEHPLLEKHFYSKFKMNRLLPKSWLHSQYPDDVKF